MAAFQRIRLIEDFHGHTGKDDIAGMAALEECAIIGSLTKFKPDDEIQILCCCFQYIY